MKLRIILAALATIILTLAACTPQEGNNSAMERDRRLNNLETNLARTDQQVNKVNVRIDRLGASQQDIKGNTNQEEDDQTEQMTTAQRTRQTGGPAIKLSEQEEEDLQHILEELEINSNLWILLSKAQAVQNNPPSEQQKQKIMQMVQQLRDETNIIPEEEQDPLSTNAEAFLANYKTAAATLHQGIKAYLKKDQNYDDPATAERRHQTIQEAIATYRQFIEKYDTIMNNTIRRMVEEEKAGQIADLTRRIQKLQEENVAIRSELATLTAPKIIPFASLEQLCRIHPSYQPFAGRDNPEQEYSINGEKVAIVDKSKTGACQVGIGEPDSNGNYPESQIKIVDGRPEPAP